MKFAARLSCSAPPRLFVTLPAQILIGNLTINCSIFPHLPEGLNTLKLCCRNNHFIFSENNLDFLPKGLEKVVFISPNSGNLAKALLEKQSRYPSLKSIKTDFLIFMGSNVSEEKERFSKHNTIIPSVSLPSIR